MSSLLPHSFLDERLSFALYSSSKAVVGLHQPYLSKIGITYPQYLVFLALSEHQEVSVRELGELLFLNSATLTPLLQRMASADLVVRTRSTADERITLVRLTEKAKELQPKIADMQQQVRTAVGLEPSEFARLRQQLKDLNASVRDT